MRKVGYIRCKPCPLRHSYLHNLIYLIIIELYLFLLKFQIKRSVGAGPPHINNSKITRDIVFYCYLNKLDNF